MPLNTLNSREGIIVSVFQILLKLNANTGNVVVSVSSETGAEDC